MEITMAGTNAAKLRMFAIREKDNEIATLAFVLALIGIGLIYTVFDQVRQSFHWMRRRKGSSKSSCSLVAVFRNIRKVSLRRVPGSPSLGHTGIITIFVSLNVFCTFVRFSSGMGTTTLIASRTGWLAIANLVFLIFFALKNTPLAFLTAWSYERLNCLHRIAGYAALVHTIIHTAFYAYYFCSVGRSSFLLTQGPIFGSVAGLCWVLLAAAAIFIRRWWYELFYYLHVSLWVVSIVTLGFHQPDLTSKIVFGTVISGCIWGLDRIVRFVRLMIHSTNNTATLTPLPNGGTRVTLVKALKGANAGKHCFLWIPGIRMFETHPFTIASPDPLEFVVASHDGFTADLHRYAAANPGVPLKASIEGPYGTVPNPSAFETVVLVAGGSGASFTFGLANALLGRLKSDVTKRVVFVWVVKYNSYLTWFATHLVALRNDARFTVRVFVTRSEPPQPPGSSDGSEYSAFGQFRKGNPRDAVYELQEFRSIRPSGSQSSIDLESAPASNSKSPSAEAPTCSVSLHNIPIEYRRPDVATMIREAISDTACEDRVLISGCGPNKLMDLIRETTADCIHSKGPSIELHCEQFGW